MSHISATLIQPVTPCTPNFLLHALLMLSVRSLEPHLACHISSLMLLVSHQSCHSGHTQSANPQPHPVNYTTSINVSPATPQPYPGHNILPQLHLHSHTPSPTTSHTHLSHYMSATSQPHSKQPQPQPYPCQALLKPYLFIAISLPLTPWQPYLQSHTRSAIPCHANHSCLFKKPIMSFF